MAVASYVWAFSFLACEDSFHSHTLFRLKGCQMNSLLMLRIKKSATRRSVFALCASLLITFALISTTFFFGCSSPLPSRQEGEFPNIPELMDSLPTLTDEEYVELMDLTEDMGSFFMRDLDGWHECSDIYLDINGDDNRSLVLWAGDLPKGSSTNYFVLQDGEVIQSDSQSPFEGDGVSVANLVNDALGTEEILAQSVVDSFDYEEESDVAEELLYSCGIDHDSDNVVDTQLYTKASPIDAMMEVLNDDSATSQFGSTYHLIGETSTPSGEILYYKVDVYITNLVLSVQPRSGYPSYLSISKDATHTIRAEFSLDEPFELPEASDYETVSSTPIADATVFHWLASQDPNAQIDSTYDTATIPDDTTSLKKGVYYRRSTDFEAVYAFSIEDNDMWWVSFQAIINGTVPSMIGEDVNGQGVLSGSFTSYGYALADDGAHLEIEPINGGIVVQCVDRVTWQAAEIEGTYYSDLNVALS